MTEMHKTRDLLATLRDALQKLEGILALTRDGVDEIASQVGRLRGVVEALGALRQGEDTSVGIDMLVDAAADFLEAFKALESGILDAQGDVNTLEAAMENDTDGQTA